MKPQNDNAESQGRREFLGAAATGAAALALAAALPAAPKEACAAATGAGPGQAPLRLDKDVAVIASVCLSCNAVCGVRGVVKDGRLESVSGNPYHPYSMRFEQLPPDAPLADALKTPSSVCSKAMDAISQTYNPYRLVKPLKRSGPRGSGKFEPIEWETLVAEIADGGELFAHLGEKRKVEGLKALDSDEPIDPDDASLGSRRNGFTLITGRLQSGKKEFIDRFVKQAMGSQNRIGHTDICGLGFRMGNWALTCQKQVELKTDPLSAEYILVFGANIYEALQPGINTYGAIAAKRRADGGLSFAVADPRATKAGAHSAEWLPVKPGHDGALALGMARYMLENGLHSEAFLSAPNIKTAKERGFGAVSNASYLVIRQKGHRRDGMFLRLKDVDPARGGDAGEAYMVLDPDAKKAVAAESAASAALSGEVAIKDYFGNVFTAVPAFAFFRESVMEHTLDEYAAISGVPREQIERVARQFASHGTKAGVTQYHGAGNYADGTHAAYAVAVLPLLIGSIDMKGGYMKSGGGAGSPVKGLYDLAHFDGERKPSGARISREKSHYEKTAEYKRKKKENGTGYPARRPWFPFSQGGLSCETLAGMDQKYPYPVKVLFTFFYNGVYSTPGGYRFKETLADPDKVPLFVSIDTAVNETNIYADYIVPELCFPEGHYGWLNAQAPVMKFTGVRTPMIEPLTGKTADGRPFCTETLLIDLAVRMGLPGFGEKAIKDKDGALYPLKKAEDFYLRGYANLAANAKLPPATDAEAALVEKTYPVARFKDVMTPDQWRAVCTLITRGGVFTDYASRFEGEAFKHGLPLYALYNEDLGATVNAMTGERFSPVPRYAEPATAQGKKLEDMDKGYDFFVVTYKKAVHTQSRSLWYAYGMRIAPENFVEMRAEDAARLKLKDGDAVRLVSASNPEGVKGKLKVTELVRPGCIGASFHFGHSQFGATALAVKDAKSVFLGGEAVASADGTKADPAYLSGFNPNDVSRLDPGLADTPLIDLAGGFPDFSSTRVKVVKA